MDRSNQQGGGCLMYYREGLDVIPKLKLEVKSVEATWIEVICRSQREQFTDRLKTRIFKIDLKTYWMIYGQNEIISC